MISSLYFPATVKVYFSGERDGHDKSRKHHYSTEVVVVDVIGYGHAFLVSERRSAQNKDALLL